MDGQNNTIRIAYVTSPRELFGEGVATDSRITPTLEFLQRKILEGNPALSNVEIAAVVVDDSGGEFCRKHLAEATPTFNYLRGFCRQQGITFEVIESAGWRGIRGNPQAKHAAKLEYEERMLSFMRQNNIDVIVSDSYVVLFNSVMLDGRTGYRGLIMNLHPGIATEVPGITPTRDALARRNFFTDDISERKAISQAIAKRAGKGRPPLIVGRRGRCVYRFFVSGIGAHGAGAGGVSAIGLAITLAQALERVPMPRARMGQCRLFVRKFQSESASLAAPVEAMLEADVHYVLPYTPEKFLAYLKRGLRAVKFPKGCSWRVEIPKRKTPYLPAYETKLGTPAARRFLSAYRKEIGGYSTAHGLTVADENVLSAENMPVITLGPAGGGAHSAGEWVSKSDFLLLSEKVPRIVQRMLE